MNAKAQLFIISHEANMACMPESADDLPFYTQSSELPKIIADMVEFGIFRLPYGEVDVRILGKNNLPILEVHDLQLTRKISVAEAHALFNESINVPVYATGRVINASGLAAYQFSSEQWLNMKLPSDGYHRRAEYAAESAAIRLILTLSASNAEKRTKHNKRAALGIGKAKTTRYSSITYINIPKELSNDSNHLGGTTGRTVRCHLRRGHARRQHFGAGNSQIKKVWIAPLFVNLDEEYVERSAYKIGVPA